jgi:hypothetical protein
MFTTLALVLVWIAYYSGYGNGLKAGIDQQYSSIYASSGVQLKVLELINDAETLRAEKALLASIESDLLFLSTLRATKEELTTSNLLLSSLTSFTREDTAFHAMEDKDVGQLESRLSKILMNKK